MSNALAYHLQEGTEGKQRAGDRREAPLSPAAPFPGFSIGRHTSLSVLVKLLPFGNEKMNPSWREDHTCVQTHSPGERDGNQKGRTRESCLFECTVGCSSTPPSMNYFQGRSLRGTNSDWVELIAIFLVMLVEYRQFYRVPPNTFNSLAKKH